MGSRMMHLVIAHEVSKQIKIKDKSAYYLGSIIPDAAEQKDDAHFFAGDVSDGTRNIDFEDFITKYLNPYSLEERDFLLGYLVHLIADDIWLKWVYLRWLKERIDKDSTCIEKYHEDFKVLNGLLLDENSELIKESLNTAKLKGDYIKELNVEDFENFSSEAIDDFNFESTEKELNIFTIDQIQEYINLSVNRSNEILKAL
jgi:Zinc dependent phospholipase C